MLLLTAGTESCQKNLVGVTSNSCSNLREITAKERMVQAELSSQTRNQCGLWQSCKLPLKQKNVAWTLAAGSLHTASCRLQRKTWASPLLLVSSLTETKAGTSLMGLGVTCRQVRWVRTITLLEWLWRSSRVTSTVAPLSSYCKTKRWSMDCSPPQGSEAALNTQILWIYVVVTPSPQNRTQTPSWHWGLTSAVNWAEAAAEHV